MSDETEKEIEGLEHNGYDSDNIIPIVENWILEVAESYHEQEIQTEDQDGAWNDDIRSEQAPLPEKVPPDVVPVGFVAIPIEILQGMRKGDLQDELKLCGLSTRVNKPELLERMKMAMADEVPI